MKELRGVGSVLFVLLIAGLFLALAWVGFSKMQGDLVQNPEELTKAMTSEKVTEEMAEYNTGVIYSFGALAASAYGLQERDGTYASLCSNGKISRSEPEVVNGLMYVACGPSGECATTPYVYRTEAGDRCYASKNEYAISAKIYDADGSLISTCMDATEADYGVSVADPATFRCRSL